MSVTDTAHAAQFASLAMGAVLFTLLVQGMTMGRLVRRLGLDRPDLDDQVARVEGWLMARRHALDQVELLAGTELAAAGVSEGAKGRLEAELAAGRRELRQLRLTRMDPVTECARDRVCVITEAKGRVTVQPPAAVFEVLRQVPMIERGERLDSILIQTIEQATVKIAAIAVQRSITMHHARPCDGKTVGVDA